MLPPVDDAVLQSNPDFAALYTTLTSVVLNANGSTKAEPNAKERNAVREELKRRRIQAAKRHFLTFALSSATPAAPRLQPRPASAKSSRDRDRDNAAALPAELLDLLLLLPPLLAPSTSLPPASLQLLMSSRPFTSLDTHLPQLATLVSDQLHASALHLARLTSPSTNPSYLHRHVAPLPAHVAGLQATLAFREASLGPARRAAATALLALLRAHAAALAQHVRALEAKHGAVARGLELAAAEGALAARRAELDAGLALGALRRDVYGPEVRGALARYARHLGDARRRLEEGIAGARRELAAYGVDVEDRQSGGPRDGREPGDDDDDDEDDEDELRPARKQAKGDTMREIAKAYRSLGLQIDDVKADLARLEVA